MLDEPTNHLDIESIAWLEDYLKSYAGAILLVSHDRAFLDPIVDKVYELSPAGLRVYQGNLSAYVEKIKAEGRLNLKNSPTAQAKPVSSYKERKMQASKKRAELSALKKNVARLESEIAAAESDLAEIEAEMASPDFFKRGAQCSSITESYNALKSKIDALYSDWESATQSLQDASADE